MDVAGVIDEIGPDTATDLDIGDRVMAIVVPAGQHGGYSDSLVLPAQSVARIPAGATLVEASTLPMNALTARKALDMLALPSGSTIAVTGAAGAFGGYVVQLAKADGLRVIADASEADEQLVRDLGADVVVRRGDDVAARIREVGARRRRRASPTAPSSTPSSCRRSATAAPSRPSARSRATPSGTSPSTWCGSASTCSSRPSSIGCASRSRTVRSRSASPRPTRRRRRGRRQARLEAGGTRGRLVIEFAPEP